jgi:hypothetical protein
MSTVADIIGKVSQDIRSQLAVTGTGEAILIDYTNRIHKQILRFSRWDFILSEPQYFMTYQGQTDYWIGTGAPPEGQVNTGLVLTDVDRIQDNSVWDLSNYKQLKSVGRQPVAPQQMYRSGQSRPGLPATFWQNHNDPFTLHIYPGPSNSNPYQPYPATPILSATVSGGSLPLRTYFVRTTFVDSNGGESVGSDIESSWVPAAGKLLSVISPNIDWPYTDTGIQYGHYNVYAGTQEGGETLQNVSPIAIGTNWTEPSTGLTNTGQSVPTASTIAQMGGYIIRFNYYKDRVVLTSTSDTLQIPDDYEDVVVHGVNAYAFKFLGLPEQASESMSAYKSGCTEMVWDKNLFPKPDFMRPDPSTYVNQQEMGILPPFF